MNIGIVILSLFIGFFIGWSIFRRKPRKIRLQNSNMDEINELGRALAHEIRNPLNTIKMNIQLLGEELGEDKKFARIESELSRLDGILKSFLYYTKLPTPSFGKIDINDIIVDVVEIIRPRSENISIEMRLTQNLPKINADGALLSEVLHNLIQNAIDASNDNGTIIVESGRQSNNIFFSVSDRGAGISPEMLDKIFKPYFSTKRSGVGIGMAVVKKIVEAHSGKIQVQSRLGKGTRIVIEIGII
ncbi:ATP-binding protein [bacterium]|nr:ATP-binding protein [bacterium]